jgi:hypothetical protein
VGTPYNFDLCPTQIDFDPLPNQRTILKIECDLLVLQHVAPFGMENGGSQQTSRIYGYVSIEIMEGLMRI